MIILGCMLASVHARAGTLSGEVSLASQLVDRGLAVAPPTPAVQGSVAWTTQSGWSLGLSGGVELRSPEHVAASVVQLARAWPVADHWQMQASVLYYHYAGRLRANVYEPGVYWTYRDILTFGLSGAYVEGAEVRRLHPAVDLDFHWPLFGRFYLSGGAGVAYYEVSYGRPPDEGYYTGYYRYGQVGLLWNHGAWRVELDRVAVDPDARRYLHGLVASSWLTTISRSF